MVNYPINIVSHWHNGVYKYIKPLGHYTSIEAFEKIIKPNTINILATHYASLDDKMEFWRVKQLLEPLKEELSKILSEEYDPKETVYPYLVSLCRSIDNYKMWKEYGHNGKGVCMVFDRETLEKTSSFSGDGAPGFIQDIVYCDKDIEDVKDGGNTKDFEQLKDSAISNYNKFSRKYSFDPKIDAYEFALAFLKGKKYEFESETRLATMLAQIIMHFDDGIITEVNEEITTGAFELNGKRRLNMYLPSESLFGVILGPYCTANDFKRIHSILKENHYPVRVFISKYKNWLLK